MSATPVAHDLSEKTRDAAKRIQALLTKAGVERSADFAAAMKIALRELSSGSGSWERTVRSGELKAPLQRFVIATKNIRLALNDIERIDNLLMIQLERHFRKIDLNVLFALGTYLEEFAYAKVGRKGSQKWRMQNAARAAMILLRRLELPVATTKNGLFCMVAAEFNGIYGDRTADMHHACREVIKSERETSEK